MVNYILFTIGMAVTIISFISLFFLKDSKSSDNLTDVDTIMRERNKLMECIEVGEEIIHELNQISSNLIEKVDSKTADIDKLLGEWDERKERANNLPIDSNNEIAEEKENESDSMDLPLPVERELNDQDTLNRILKLKSSGYTISQIAKELDKGIGEVQLILQLKKR